jgi:hypothetical protein
MSVVELTGAHAPRRLRPWGLTVVASKRIGLSREPHRGPTWAMERQDLDGDGGR